MILFARHLYLMCDVQFLSNNDTSAGPSSGEGLIECSSSVSNLLEGSGYQAWPDGWCGTGDQVIDLTKLKSVTGKIELNYTGLSTNQTEIIFPYLEKIDDMPGYASSSLAEGAATTGSSGDLMVFGGDQITKVSAPLLNMTTGNISITGLSLVEVGFPLLSSVAEIRNPYAPSRTFIDVRSGFNSIERMKFLEFDTSNGDLVQCLSQLCQFKNCTSGPVQLPVSICASYDIPFDSIVANLSFDARKYCDEATTIVFSEKKWISNTVSAILPPERNCRLDPGQSLLPNKCQPPNPLELEVCESCDFVVCNETIPGSVILNIK